ncbi:MAG: hypothetical protein D6753_00120 [Planctomycetota bacterium]|nr:MAG: hypothetical protein D6753_00120 [Planctomycetota bacterium]
MDPRIDARLRAVARRIQVMYLGWAWATVFLLSAAIGFGLAHAQTLGLVTGNQVFWGWATGTLLLTLGAAWAVARHCRDLQAVAQRIERRFPSLNQGLITASELQPTAQGTFGYLQRAVISEAIRHDIIHRWRDVVSRGKLVLAWSANIPTAALVLAVAWLLWRGPVGPPPTVLTAERAKSNQVLPPVIDPGDTEIERGSSLIITARFDGKLPDDVWLVHAPRGTADERPAVRIPMRQSLQDPIFAAYLYGIEQPMEYQVEYDQTTTRPFRIDVFDYPSMVRADAVLTFPAYTQLEPKTVLDTRRVTAAVGTRLTWQIHLNKPVVLAELVPLDANDEGERLVLDAVGSDPMLVVATTTMLASQRWRLHLVDAEGRDNAQEVILSSRVLPNRESAVRLTTGGDALVSPLQEFDIAAKVTDDFAILAAGIGYQFAGGDLVERAIELSQAATKEATIQHTIDFEALGAQPNQLLAYYVWAEDMDEQGQVRRSVSDIFFAEVRPFDEIYRQGQQPTAQQQQQQQGQPQGNQQTEELLELQKQIMAATWNVLRRAQNGRVPASSRGDIAEIAASQRQAQELLEEKAAEAPPGTEMFLASARKNMQAAAEMLEQAGASLAATDLQEAQGLEQAAYQDLLRLQSREHEVVRSQQRGSQSRSQRSQARQQQIDQLQLDNQENRYENQRLAQDQQNQEQSQLRQILSRLRELAARQEDLNEQLRELEAALQAAETEQQREEIRRQLERLREQQQEMLQDSDELQQRMQTSSSQAVQQAEQQMEQARENLQRSSEALRSGNTSQALAAGTRAEETLEEIEEEVRQQAANRFAETVQTMRDRAAELERRQSDIVRELDAAQSSPSPGLRSNPTQRQAPLRLRQQQEELQDLLQEIEQVVGEAEESEPLLAQRLYDTYRQAQDEKAMERLSVTEQLLERNLEEQGRELAEQSIDDLRQLREGIETAAEAVLGSEIESLRLALNQLESLSQQVDNEIQSATGRRPGGSQRGEDEAGRNAAGPEQADQRSDQRRPGPQANVDGNGTASERSRQDSAEAPEQRGQPSGRLSDPRAEQSGASPGDQPNGAPPNPQRVDPSDQPADRAPDQQPGQSGQQAGQQPSQPSGRQPGQQSGQPGTPASDQSGDRTGASQSSAEGSASSPGPGSAAPTERLGQRAPTPGQPGLRQQSSSGQGSRPAESNRSNVGTWTTGGGNPITGEAFREWSDRLRDVEELVGDPELRWEATQIRQAAREIRREYKKHAADPKWSEVEELVARPLRELKRKVSDELIRRAAEKTEIVPIDRDPVPAEFSSSVEKYYENLGSDR